MTTGLSSGGAVVAGTASSSGKTTACISLSAALRRRGFDVQPGKAGPDFLDAAWLAKAAGRPCPNLDLWMAPDPSLPGRLLSRFSRNCDFVLVEGAMGLYDGDSHGRASSAQLAVALHLPVLLVINAKGMGQSVAPLAAGFFSWPMQGCMCDFCGIVCSHTGSPRHEKILAAALAPVCTQYGVPLLGFLPAKEAPLIPARHLGLRQACEMELDMDKAAAWYESHVDVDLFIRRTSGAWHPLHSQAASAAAPGPRIAIAADEAFAFCYADLPLLLTDLGASVVYFSPLADSGLPACDGVYIPGGYPELYAEKLAANAPMLRALRSAAQRGIPLYGECGGYMYLLEYLTDSQGVRWPMTGILPGEAAISPCLAALGYRSACSCWLECEIVRGHEFHYANASGEKAPPLWRLADADGNDKGLAGQRLENAAGSWLHLYPQGSVGFWRSWLVMAERRKHGNA